MKIGIFWNSFPFIGISETKIKETLNYYLLDKNIEHENFDEYFEKATIDSLNISLLPIDIINRDNSIINCKQFQDFDALFILAELDWHDHKLTDFYGITIARKLRLKNIKCPVFICSFMSEEYLSSKGQFKILGFRSHYFLHLPKGIVEDIEVSPLDEMELLDCKMHYCGIEGSIREIYHRKQHILPEDDFVSAKKHILDLLEEINQLMDLPEYLKPEIEKLIVEVQGKEDIKELKIFCKSDESRILAHLKDQDKDDTSKQLFDDIQGEWKILILEDVRKDIDSLFDSLKSAGIKEENILHAISFDEAKKIIENDKEPEKNDSGNKISVVICDYRLEKDGKQKGKQGYSFVEWLSKQDRYNEIFVYSGLARRFLKETFKRYNIRVTVNSKYDITDRMGDFVDEVIEKGNEIAELIINRPTSEAWREMQLFYKHYRQWPGYDNMEREISEVSRNIINQIKYLRETIEKYDLKEKISFSQIPTLPNLAGRIFKDFEKSQVEANPELISNFSPENIKLYHRFSCQ